MGGACSYHGASKCYEEDVGEQAKQDNRLDEEGSPGAVFQKWTTRQANSFHELQEAMQGEFASMDDNHDGIISPEEFQNNSSSILNPLLANLWPTLSEALEQIIKDNIQCGINAASRKFSILDGHLKIDAVELGQDPPRVSSAQTYTVMNANNSSVQIDLRLLWEPKIELQIELGPTSLGINSIRFDGQASLVFTPLAEELPVVGGFHIFFLNAPDIEPKLTGLGGVAHWQHVEDSAKEAIRKLLSQVMVLPHRLAIKFPSTTIEDMAAYNRPPPIGVLEMDVLEVRGLPRRTSIVAWVSLGHCDHITKPSHGSTSSWHDEMPRFLVDHERQALQLELREETHLWHDEHLAQMPPGSDVQTLISAHHMAAPTKDPVVGGWHKVQLKRGNKKGHDEAEVRLGAHYYELRNWMHSQSSITLDDTSITHRCKDRNLVVVGAKVYLIRGAKFEELRASQIRLEVNGEHAAHHVMEVSQIEAEHAVGVSQSTIEMVWKMHTQAKLSTEVIASIVSEPEEIVQKIISAVRQEDGDLMLCGCNSVIYAIVAHPKEATVRLHFGSKNYWAQVGDDVPVSSLLQAGGRCEKRIWKCKYKEPSEERNSGLFHRAKDKLVGGSSTKGSALEVEVAWEVYAAIPVAHKQAIELWDT